MTERIPRITKDQLDSMTDVKCPHCKGIYFELNKAFKLKKLSALMTGNPKDEIFPVPVLLCLKCNGVVDLNE